MAKKINANKLAAETAQQEGGLVSVSVAQVKEVQRITFTKLAREFPASQALELIERYKRA